MRAYVCTHIRNRKRAVYAALHGDYPSSVFVGIIFGRRAYVCEPRCVCAWPNPLVAPVWFSLASLSTLSLSLSLPRCICVCIGVRKGAHMHTCTCVTGFDRTACMHSRSRALCACMCVGIRESGINPGLLVVCAPPAVQIQNPTHTTQLILTPPSPLPSPASSPFRPLATTSSPSPLASLTRRILCVLHRRSALSTGCIRKYASVGLHDFLSIRLKRRFSTTYRSGVYSELLFFLNLCRTLFAHAQ